MPRKKTFIGTSYNGVELCEKPHEFSYNYMQAIDNLLWTMTERHSKVLVARLDLRFPKDHEGGSFTLNEVMASNAPIGKVIVNIQDLASGKSTEKTFDVK